MDVVVVTSVGSERDHGPVPRQEQAEPERLSVRSSEELVLYGLLIAIGALPSGLIDTDKPRTTHSEVSMPKDPLQLLLEHLRAEEGTRIPTSTLGRLGRTAFTGARVGLGALVGKMRGQDLNLGSLSPEALGRLVESLGELKGIAMKMGQILSYVDGSLDPEARQFLAVLQRYSQPTPFAQIEQTIREDLGSRGEALLARLEREPVAVASIGQVHRAVVEDGTSVAVKVRHPGIDTAIRADFKTAAIVKVMARAFAPGIDVAAMLEEAQGRFLEECDYALEAQRQVRFVELFAGHPSIAIPAVHLEWSGRRVLTTSWREGSALDAFLQAQPACDARERAASSLYEFYVGTLYRHGLFNADPHPGNLLFSPEGRVTILDHGCVREFDRDTVTALVRLSLAVRGDDERQIQAALGAIGMPRPAADFDVTRGLLRGFFAPLLTPGRHAIPADGAMALGELVKLKRKLLKMRLPGKLMFLFRIRFGLYAVLSRIGAELDWSALEDEVTGDLGH